MIKTIKIDRHGSTSKHFITFSLDYWLAHSRDAKVHHHVVLLLDSLCFSGEFVVWRLSQLLCQLHDPVLHPVQKDFPQHPQRLGEKPQRRLLDTFSNCGQERQPVTHPCSHWSSRCWLTWGSPLTSGLAFWLVCCTWASGTRPRRFWVTRGSCSSPCCSWCSPLWCPQCSHVSPRRPHVSSP